MYVYMFCKKVFDYVDTGPLGLAVFITERATLSK